MELYELSCESSKRSQIVNFRTFAETGSRTTLTPVDRWASPEFACGANVHQLAHAAVRSLRRNPLVSATWSGHVREFLGSIA